MIAVEIDASDRWDDRVDWVALAERAARAAVAHSRHAALADSRLTAEVSMKFTDDSEVRALNAAYRNRDKATNVLSFPMIDAALLPSLAVGDSGEVLLGDVVLALETCAAEADERGIAVTDHATHLVVHGILHLLGYDHERGDTGAQAMEDVERAALASIGVADPYQTEVQS